MSDQHAEYESINIRLAKASDAWLRAQTQVELAEQVFEKAKAEYFEAYTALVDANDARIFEAVERTDAS